MPNFRYVAVSPDRREQHRAIGKAHALHDFLIDHQTDASGLVWYGRVISYAWIRSKWLTAPSERTLERHMARLKAAGLVRVQALPMQFGMRVTVLQSAKWPEPKRQMDLFPAADVLSITRGKAVGKRWGTTEKVASNGSNPATKVAAPCRQKWRRKAVRSTEKKQTRASSLTLARLRSSTMPLSRLADDSSRSRLGLSWERRKAPDMENQKLEKRWLEDARQQRLAAVRTPNDAIRFIEEFGPIRPEEHKPVFALRRSDGKRHRD